MALALYRKYRPATFAEVVGQEHVTGPLMTAVDSGRINHAYLFSGPRGCGKTSSARILARSLNCEQGPTSHPCGACQSCIDLAPDGAGNIDVIEIDAASHGGVDDARELRERAFQLPVQSRYKIYIIDEAHMVSNQGFNALLKVVEEPPESVVFIFATTEPDKVLATIRSRTHHYPFRLVPPAAMRDLLERNCAAEGVQVGAAVLPLVVRAGGGSVRDSQSLLDQLIAGAGPDGITYEEALALLGVTDAALLDDMVEAVGVADGATVFGTVNRLIDAGHDPRRFGADLLDRLRDLILIAAVPDAGEKGLIDAPVDHLERLVDQASRLGLSTLSRLADIVHVGLTEMRGTTAPRLGLELICARMLLPAVGDDAASMTQRIERLERRMEIGGVPTPGSGSAGDSPRGRVRVAASADGLTPRQRAEAELAAGRAPTPQGPEPSSEIPASGHQAPSSAGTPSGAGSEPSDSVSVPPNSASRDETAQPDPSRADAAKRRDPGDTQLDPERSQTAQAEPGNDPGPAPRSGTRRAEQPAERPSSPRQESRPVARDPRGAQPTGGAAPAVSPQPATEPAAGSGWPEVKVPGSGRSQQPVASGDDADSPAEQSDFKATETAAPDSSNSVRDVAEQSREVAVAPSTGGSETAGPAVQSAATDRTEPERPPVPPVVSERTASALAASVPASDTAASAPQTTPPAPASAGSGAFDVAEVRRQWRVVVDVVKRSSRAGAALVEAATPVSVRENTLIITTPPALVRRLSQQHDALKGALHDVLGVTWAIQVTDGAPPQGAGGADAESPDAPPADDEDDYSADPEDESVTDPRAGLDPGQAAVNLLRDELGAEEIVEQ
ncbi:DNA polymerase III subunit gamma and tau [Cumulibacter soli]|uniref:DNA polymerase III subunit gamma and tau n=1 Tax=Cumulibacter soli TaxID=2546344 RepID=UPI001067E814|nr:DNA polymerase III subunit gamma and tau [Cumulibacter soli]